MIDKRAIGYYVDAQFSDKGRPQICASVKTSDSCGKKSFVLGHNISMVKVSPYPDYLGN